MTILDRIFARKREELNEAKRLRSLADLKSAARDADPPRGFLTALKNSPGKPALIAEVKKASPSEGVIRADFDAEEIASTYAQHGAACLSVLTDVDFFQGSEENLRKAREASGLPVLRKDFTVESYHVYEARAMGADAILLIAAMLEETVIRDLHSLAEELGMDVLLETHNEAEAEMAVEMGADLIGVNNRDLATFRTDLAATERLARIILPHAFLVSESALKTRSDVLRAHGAGAGAVLIGTTFCASENIGAKVKEVMGD